MNRAQSRALKRICAFVMVGALLVPLSIQAVECSREVPRERLPQVEEDLERLGRETRGFAEEGEALTKELQEKEKLVDRARDPAKRETVTADILYLKAKVSELNRKEVESALAMINEISGKLERIREVLLQCGIFPPREDFPGLRERIRKFFGTAARFLDRWGRFSPRKEGEISALKTMPQGVLSTSESPANNLGTSQEELSRTMQTLDTTYTQLLTLAGALEFERQDLMMRNNMAIARLVLLRLNRNKRLGCGRRWWWELEL